MAEEPYACVICGSDMERVRSQNGDWQRPDSKARTFDLWRCRKDGFGRILPLPSDEELARHYDLTDYYTRGGEKGVPRMSALGRLLEKAVLFIRPNSFGRGTYIRCLPRDTGVDLLDIGCGSGKLMRSAAALGHRVWGVEPDANAGSRQPDFELPVYPGTAEAMPVEIRQRQYDAIAMVHVLEHVTDPGKTFDNLHDLLRPGGTAYIEVPNCASWDARLAQLSWPHLEIPRHLNFWTVDNLSRMAAEKGFDVARTSHVGYARQFSAGWRQKGRQIAKYHADAAWFRRLRAWPDAYSVALFLITLLAPERRKNDTAIVVIRRPA
jgi:SAM-dependent methyltransferase